MLTPPSRARISSSAHNHIGVQAQHHPGLQDAVLSRYPRRLERVESDPVRACSAGLRWRITVSTIDLVARPDDLVRRYARAHNIDARIEAVATHLPKSPHLVGRRPEAEASPQFEPIARRARPLEVDHDHVVTLDRDVAAGAEETKRRSAHKCYPVQTAVLASQAVRLCEDVALGHPGADLGRERAEDISQDRRRLPQAPNLLIALYRPDVLEEVGRVLEARLRNGFPKRTDVLPRSGVACSDETDPAIA